MTERQQTEMNDAERRELQTHREVVESPMSTEPERAASRRRIEELLWLGPSGSVKRAIAEFEKRLVALEKVKGAGGSKMTAADLKKVEKLVSDKTSDLREFVIAEAKQAAITAFVELMPDEPDETEKKD